MTSSFPSGCMAISVTNDGGCGVCVKPPLLPTENDELIVPLGSNATIRLINVELTVPKRPPTYIIPLSFTFITSTPLKILALKVLSLVPSIFKRTILLEVTLLYVIKSPPTSILPSCCINIVFTVLSNATPFTKLLSTLPSVFNLIILLCSMLLYDVNAPPTSIFPLL
ncbi:MAG: hypothetical protein DDT42_02075 [candidate division WS2 bacterium]|uniref:Uncharacterized protein n=1 Tax=Psychracetigena formicireducens TaxID=2986056 RepID=A0A9E2BIJ6_PSYF1|nr:hypothetical protein [Candidatus Psychracetigena formicireducens]